MFSRLLDPLAKKTRLSLYRLLGLENMQKMVASLEESAEKLQKQAVLSHENTADPQILKNIFTSIQALTEGVVTINKRIEAYRSEKNLQKLSDIYPKKKIIVFAGGHFFGDNVKYAYLSFLQKAETNGISCFYLPYNAQEYERLKAEGLPCLPPPSTEYAPEDIQTCLNASMLVIDNHFVSPNWRDHLAHSLLHGAKTVQLWHGIPIKEIGFETTANSKIKELGTTEIMASCGKFDYFVATNSSSRSEWARKFSFNIFLPTGYPRNDVFFRPLTSTDKINVDLKALEQIQKANNAKQRTLLYAPTFRDNKDQNWFDKSQISDFAEFCSAKDFLLYVNLHPSDQNQMEAYKKRFPQIKFIAPHTDIYPILKHIDLLITDYSSVAFDYLLLNRPIVFYRPDHAEYIARSRHLIEDHDRYLCGKEASNIGELIKAIDDSFASDPYKEVRYSLRQKLFDHSDGQSSDRLYNEILDLFDKA